MCHPGSRRPPRPPGARTHPWEGRHRWGLGVRLRAGPGQGTMALPPQAALGRARDILAFRLLLKPWFIIPHLRLKGPGTCRALIIWGPEREKRGPVRGICLPHGGGRDGKQTCGGWSVLSTLRNPLPSLESRRVRRGPAHATRGPARYWTQAACFVGPGISLLPEQPPKQDTPLSGPQFPLTKERPDP